jgi:hypothetical protein
LCAIKYHAWSFLRQIAMEKGKGNREKELGIRELKIRELEFGIKKKTALRRPYFVIRYSLFDILSDVHAGVFHSFLQTLLW